MTVQHYAKIFALFYSLCIGCSSATGSGEKCCAVAWHCCVEDGRFACIPPGSFCLPGTKVFTKGRSCGTGSTGRTCMDPKTDVDDRTKSPNGGDCTAKKQPTRGRRAGDDRLCQSGCCLHTTCVECTKKETHMFTIQVMLVIVLVIGCGLMISMMILKNCCGGKSSPDLVQPPYQRMDTAAVCYHPSAIVQEQQLPTMYTQQYSAVSYHPPAIVQEQQLPSMYTPSSSTSGHF